MTDVQKKAAMSPVAWASCDLAQHTLLKFLDCCAGVAASYGCRTEDVPDWSDIPYPATINDDAMARMVRMG